MPDRLIEAVKPICEKWAGKRNKARGQLGPPLPMTTRIDTDDLGRVCEALAAVDRDFAELWQGGAVAPLREAAQGQAVPIAGLTSPFQRTHMRRVPRRAPVRGGMTPTGGRARLRPSRCRQCTPY